MYRREDGAVGVLSRPGGVGISSRGCALPFSMQQRIEFVSRDRTGITAIVTETGVTDIRAAVASVRGGTACFVAGPTSWERAEVTCRDALGGAYLFANWDGTKRNNLHDLAGPAPFRPGGRPPSRVVRALVGVLGVISFGYTHPRR